MEDENKPEIKEVYYTEKERAFRGGLIAKLRQARDDRESPHPEFDDMTYSQYYDTNKRADLAYRTPKKNRKEKRVVTGVVRKKDNDYLATLLNYNFTPNIVSYDMDDLIIPDLGEAVEACVIKSRTLEDIPWEEKRKLIYREFIAQGDVFVEELWRETTEIDRVDINDIEWSPGDKISQAQFVDLPKRKHERAEVRMVSGKKVFLGDIKQPYIQLQPFIFTYEIIDRSEAQGLYGDWDRWDKVPEEVDETVAQDVSIGGAVYRELDWSLTAVPKNKVGVLKFQSRKSNNYQIMLNGVMMLPINFPLTKVSPDGHYTIVQGKNEDMPDFAYSKSVPAKTMVDEAILNDFTRMMIIKMEQSFDPSKGSRGRKVYPKSAFDPGKITYGVKKDDLFPLVETDGITSGEFSFYNLVKQGIDDKTINKTFAGQSRTDNATATQVIEEKNQQLLMLGLTLDGILNLEKALVWKRIGTIINNWTTEQDKRSMDIQDGVIDIFKTITVDSEMHGEEGRKVIRFATQMPDQYEQLDEERREEARTGKKTSIVYINPRLLRMFKGYWYIVMVPRDRNGDRFSQMMFMQVMTQAMDTFGPQSINVEYMKKRYTQVFNESSKMFLDQGTIENNMAQDALKNATGDVKPKEMKPTMEQAKKGGAVEPPKLEIR